MDDLSDAAREGNAKDAELAWLRGKDYINGYVRIVNFPINARVGDKFPLITASFKDEPPPAPVAEAPAAPAEPEAPPAFGGL